MMICRYDDADTARAMAEINGFNTIEEIDIGSIRININNRGDTYFRVRLDNEIYREYWLVDSVLDGQALVSFYMETFNPTRH